MTAAPSPTTAEPPPPDAKRVRRDDERVCRWCRHTFESVPVLLDHVVDVHLVGR